MDGYVALMQAYKKHFMVQFLKHHLASLRKGGGGAFDDT